MTKLDDYQSWLIDVGGHKVLVDPWLTETFAFAQGRWLFNRGRNVPGTTTSAQLPTVDVLVLTSHFADHLNPQTLMNIDKNTPVVGSRAAVRMVRKLGFEATTVLQPGDRFQLGGDGSLQAVAPAFPYKYNAIGVVFRENSTNKSAYLETHVINKGRAPVVDAIITTVESVRLMGIQLAMDANRTIGVIEHIRPAYIVPTGNRPNTSGGALSRILRVHGSVEYFRMTLESREGLPQLADLGPGESLTLS